jgi:hypothetical protein
LAGPSDWRREMGWRGLENDAITKAETCSKASRIPAVPGWVAVIGKLRGEPRLTRLTCQSFKHSRACLNVEHGFNQWRQGHIGSSKGKAAEKGDAAHKKMLNG